ncbi:MAG: hypothetical protein ACKOB4_14925, partial [Acidobacteriota bacterium]
MSWRERWRGVARPWRWLVILAVMVMLQAESLAQSSLPPTAQALLERARQANPTRYQFALDRGARITATSD